MEINDKNTTLSDDAAIYQRRDENAMHKSWKGMNGKERWQFYKDDYFKRTLVALVITALVIYLAVDLFTPEPEVILQVAVGNYAFGEESLAAFTDRLNEALGVTEDTQIVFDASYSFSSYDYSSATRFTTYVAANEIDIFIAPLTVFQNYALNEIFTPLDEVLSPALFEAVSKDIYYSPIRLSGPDVSPSSTEVTDDIFAFGIFCDESSLFDGYSFTVQADRPVLGIVVSGENREEAIQFIEYLLNQ